MIFGPITVAAAVAGGLAPASTAHSSPATFELSAAIGYASNPLLQIGESSSSAFARLSAYAAHSWLGERGSTSVSAFLENSTYFKHYGSRQIIDVSAHTEQRTSERVRLFGTVGFSSDLAGQLSNRFVSAPTVPIISDPQEPTATLENPDFLASRGRQYRVTGRGGATIDASERSSTTISGGIQRISFVDELVHDYTVLSAAGSYDRLLSERSSTGLQVNVSRTHYDGGIDQSTIVNPELTGRTELSEGWEASGAVGVAFTKLQSKGAQRSSKAPSLRGSVCRLTESERLCGHVFRNAQTSALANPTTTTSASLEWFKRLDAIQTFQFSASAARYVGHGDLDANSKIQNYSLAGNYSRRFSDRFSLGADLAVRSLRREGPNPDTDVNGSIFIRYAAGNPL